MLGIEWHRHKRPRRKLHVDEMPRWDVVGRPSMHYHVPFAARHTLHVNIPFIRARAGARGKQDRVSSRQDLRPSMTNLSFLRVQLRERLRSAPLRGDLPEAGGTAR